MGVLLNYTDFGEMMKKFIFSTILFLAVGTINLSAQPEESRIGLAVEPGGLLIQNVKPGEVYDIEEISGVTLNITNQDNRPHTYILTTHKPSMVAAREWIKGYLEIPDPIWFWFEKDEIIVDANSTAKVKMFLKIPDEEKYYNQHWSVSLLVKAKPEPGHMLGLAVAPNFQIETKTKEELEVKPDGLVAFEPSLIRLEDVTLGSKIEAKVRLYNNDDKKHRYRVSSQIFPEDPNKRQITISPNYSWISNPEWIRPEGTVKIGPGESADLSFNVKVPKDERYYGKKWEAIIFVEPEEGLSGFVRVQIETEKR